MQVKMGRVENVLWKEVVLCALLPRFSHIYWSPATQLGFGLFLDCSRDEGLSV